MSKPKLPEVSKTLPTCGRIVLCRSYRWEGELPGIVVKCNGDGTINVNVAGDDTPEVPFHCSTIKKARLFDPLTNAERSAMRALDPKTEHCEWMPYQAAKQAEQKAVSPASLTTQEVEALGRKIVEAEVAKKDAEWQDLVKNQGVKLADVSSPATPDSADLTRSK